MACLTVVHVFLQPPICEAANATPWLTDGLWGWWTFNDGTATDNSGNGRNGSLTNGPSVVEGRLGLALHFDGIDDAVVIGYIPTPSNLTVAAYVRVDSYPSPHNGGRWASIIDAGPSPDVFGLRADYRSGELKFFAYCQYNPGGFSLISTSVINLGQFYHVAFTVDSTVARLYVNGSAQPVLIVNDVKSGASAKGGVAIWFEGSTIAHYANLTVKNRPQ